MEKSVASVWEATDKHAGAEPKCHMAMAMQRAHHDLVTDSFRHLCLICGHLGETITGKKIRFTAFPWQKVGGFVCSYFCCCVVLTQHHNFI